MALISTYFTNLLKVLAIGAGFASIPLFASLASLQPPWPPAIGAVSAGLVMAGALIIWEWTRNSRIRNRRRWILSAALIAVASILGYMILYSLFVENVPGTSLRVVRGYECTRNALLVYKDACPDLPSDAFAGAEWESTELWTRQSVTTVRVGLAGAWLLFTAALTMTVGGVIAGRKF
jgi:hypothetical protein